MTTEQALGPGRDISGWAVLVGIAAVVLAAGCISWAVSSSPASNHGNDCVEALEAADELLALHDDALDIIAQVFDAFSRFELDRAEDLANQLDAAKAAELRSAYDLARKECR